MDRMQARAIAKIAYREMYAIVRKWNKGPTNWLPIDFNWSGKITIDGHEFQEHELYEGEDE
jgi:hypothetical protein